MVRQSDNDAAIELHRKVGPKAMLALSRRAGMRDFTDTGSWSESTVTAADQARLFAKLDRLVAPRHLDYARSLLRSIIEPQSWGIPRIARPEWRVLFKGGWRPAGNGSLVHQAARLERGPRTIAVAVLSDGNPNQPYGEETIQGVAARLLAPPPDAATGAAGTREPRRAGAGKAAREARRALAAAAGEPLRLAPRRGK